MPRQVCNLQEPADEAMKPSSPPSSKPSKKADTSNLSSRDKRKSANRARHRLLSIHHDFAHYLKPLLQQQQQQQQQRQYESLSDTTADNNAQPMVIVANERCGTWYALPFAPQSYCQFKSTDGHVHLFSLKRLNLPLLKTVAQAHRQGQAVWILDASNKKEMPDSFSRTLPIWCVVLNRIALRYRRELGILLNESSGEKEVEEEDYKLFVPHWIIPLEERTTMEAIIHDRVEELYQSRAIVDVPGFLQLMIKPLRPFWITPLHSELPTREQQKTTMPIVCCNASHIRLNQTETATKGDDETAAFDNKHNGNSSRIVWMQDGEFWYTPGAADDQESWARHLTPQLFWGHCQNDNSNHKEDITTPCATNEYRQSTLPFSSSMTDQEVDEWIDTLVKQARGATICDTNDASGDENCFDWIGNLHLAIGSRRAGRPPHCWDHFDAILNVTNTEYDGIRQSTTNGGDDLFYLQLPVEEGKRDRQELERWMAVGVMFCAYHARQNRRILIHCAQGRDRSVAVTMALVQIFCYSRYPLEWNRNLLDSTLSQLLLPIHSNTHGDAQIDSLPTKIDGSGLPHHCLTNFLGQEGRDRLLNGVRGQGSKSGNAPLASKESLRVVLHLIRQDREKAEPTRSTLQKLNRFFMSVAYRKP